MHDAPPPLLLQEVFPDTGAVVALLEQQAPYTPLGGWYRPDLDPDEPVNALWFQNDWVHADYTAPGADLFLHHPPYLQGARDYWQAELVEPHSVYVNMMAALPKAGPAHTDNPKFVGRERANTPMMLLRSMLWSGLFTALEIRQATAIWWLNDVEDGGLAYWADGPEQPPRRHVGNMANTALLGDNHHMFHQVERVGPFDIGMPLVGSRAQLAPTGAGEWLVSDRGAEVLRAPLADFRVSVLWKADVYRDAAEREAMHSDPLTMERVAAEFNEDLARRGETLRVDSTSLEDPATQAALGACYPEAVPVGAQASIFDAG